MKYFLRTTLILAITLAFAACAPAMAQQPRPNPPAINGLAQWTADDITAAQALSTSITGLQDPVGAACWASFSNLVGLLKQHPIPLTMKVATDLEALRLTHIALKQICENPNCGQMWTDLQNAQAALSIVPLPFSMQSICARVPAIATSTAAQTAIPVTRP